MSFLDRGGVKLPRHSILCSKTQLMLALINLFWGCVCSSRYGPIFKTSIAGHPVVVSADPEVNAFLLQREGTLVELWYLDTFSKVFALEGESRISAIGGVHKYMRTIFLSHFGGDTLKNLIPHIELAVDKALNSWSTHDYIEVKTASSAVSTNGSQISNSSQF